MEEWVVDIPTIGSVYVASKQVFVYFSGLGRPFNAAQNWQDVRNWLNRAWTLQETKNPQSMIIGGMRGVTVDPWTCQASTCTLNSGFGWTVESLRNRLMRILVSADGTTLGSLVPKAYLFSVGR